MAYKEIEREEMKFVNEIILSKNNISEQLKLLRKYREREDVQQYIHDLKKESSSDYLKYLIEKYYEGNKDLKAPKKTPLEEMFKLLLRPVTRKEKIKNPGKTDIQVGDIVLITEGVYANMEGIVEKIDNEYSELIVSIELFGENFSCEIDFDNVIKKNN